MVAVDGSHNGWRYIVLPMAHADDLVMNAVLAVSAFHRDGMHRDNISYLETNTNGLRSSAQQQHCGTEPTQSPQALYNLAIDGLRQRSNLAGCSYEANQAISVAVLVLLVAAMVTGREDYSTILSMLHSATNVLGGAHRLGATELGGFLVRQVRKNKVCAAPYISELAGIETLASESRWDQYFDCIRYCSQGQAGNSSIVATVTRVMQQAHDIYMQGVTGSNALEPDPKDKIEAFKETLEQIPEHEPGTHVLVWATFLVAAASSLESHRTFFRRSLLRHHNRSRFANLLRRINHLPHIWAKVDQGARWTELLSEAGLFLM
ncbi:hypothetical protein CKAH01_13139 [Colletotrichum kahawae]|uniref:Uncharacterized protein n=1 Tax=Colletotrichum kahawae TaxID=34407 RepID=A0AAE0DED4_COLKA|nr:hypothetical protein CKAH01_13139 [Colletotrichum kahawae]